MIRVFVGTSCGEDLESQAVLEHTIRKYASKPVEITWMQQSRTSFWSGWNTNGWRTPFTGFRWGVAAAAGYRGKAIYCDSDFIFRADIAELYEQRTPGSAFALVRSPDGKVRTDCMLINCGKAKRVLPPIDEIRAMTDQNGKLWRQVQAAGGFAAFDGDWNCIDLQGYNRADDAAIRAIHYSRMEWQPHLLKYAIPRLEAEGRHHWYDGEVIPHPRPDLQALFDLQLAEAIAAGFPPERYHHPHFKYVKKSFRGKRAKVAG